MASTAHRFLKPEDILRLNNYEFGAKAMVEGYLAGKHRSKQRGASIEFHEYRPYTPGDDPALVDWRVYARTKRHYLRTFEQETNLECHIFLDSSASMGFKGSQSELSKLEFSSFFAACLSWLVIKHRDRVSLQLFDDKIRTFLPPGSTQKHLNEILTTLEGNEPGGETSLSEALTRSAPLIKRKGSLIVISDFFDDPTAIFQSLSPYLHRGFKIHLFHILDPEEATLPDMNLTRFIDMETDKRLTLHPKHLKKAWKEALQDHRRNLRQFSTRRNVDYAPLLTNQSYFTLFDRLT